MNKQEAIEIEKDIQLLRELKKEFLKTMELLKRLEEETDE